MTDYRATKWWRVKSPDGEITCETSDEREARRAVHDGDILQRCYQRVEHEWRTVVILKPARKPARGQTGDGTGRAR